MRGDGWGCAGRWCCRRTRLSCSQGLRTFREPLLVLHFGWHLNDEIAPIVLKKSGEK